MSDVDEMHRGLLLGVAELRRSFVADGDAFHLAYRAALSTNDSDAARIDAEDFDPVFGVYRGAENMIIEGMRDLILTLDRPLLRRAIFLVSAAQARVELDEFHGSASYRTMARTFDQRLSRA